MPPLTFLGPVNTGDTYEAKDGFKKTGFTDTSFLLAGGGTTLVSNFATYTNIATTYYTKVQLQTSGQASVNWGNLTNVPTTFPATAHNHDDRYYTETESDTRFVPQGYTYTSSNRYAGTFNIETNLSGHLGAVVFKITGGGWYGDNGVDLLVHIGTNAQAYFSYSSAKGVFGAITTLTAYKNTAGKICLNIVTNSLYNYYKIELINSTAENIIPIFTSINGAIPSNATNTVVLTKYPTVIEGNVFPNYAKLIPSQKKQGGQGPDLLYDGIDEGNINIPAYVGGWHAVFGFSNSNGSSRTQLTHNKMRFMSFNQWGSWKTIAFSEDLNNKYIPWDWDGNAVPSITHTNDFSTGTGVRWLLPGFAGGTDFTFGTMFSVRSNTGNGNPFSMQMLMSNVSNSTPNFYVRNVHQSGIGDWGRVWTDKDFSQVNVTNWNTAYGWGNHASAGYLTSASLTGYVTQTSLNTQLNNYATLAGTQTFTGTNTFNQSPVVPTPTLDTHAVNRKYVTDNHYTKTEVDNLITSSNADKFVTTISISGEIEHFLNTYDVSVEFYDIATMFTVGARVQRLTTNKIKVEFDTVPANPIKVLIRKF